MHNNMMDAGRYKLIRKLSQADGYESYAALDIETSLRQDVLLNVYSGQDVIRRMVGLYYGLDGKICPDYCRIYTENGRFTAVFVLHAGESFTAAFPRRGGPDEAERQEYAESLLHAALENARLPAELLQAMLRPENLCVQKKNRRIRINAGIVPVQGGAEGRDVTRTLSPLVECVLQRRWSATDEQIDFLDALHNGDFENVSALYSAWRVLAPVMEQDRQKSKLLSKALRYVRRCGRRLVRKWKAARAQQRRAAEENA